MPADEQKFLILSKFSLYFPFIVYAFGVTVKNPLQKSKIVKIYNCFLLRILWF